MPSPQMPISKRQFSLQPSSFLRLASSHSSGDSSTPLPHTEAAATNAEAVSAHTPSVHRLLRQSAFSTQVFAVSADTISFGCSAGAAENSELKASRSADSCAEEKATSSDAELSTDDSARKEDAKPELEESADEELLATGFEEKEELNELLFPQVAVHALYDCVHVGDSRQVFTPPACAQQYLLQISRSGAHVPPKKPLVKIQGPRPAHSFASQKLKNPDPHVPHMVH